jgi:cAMP phosphodiesterase
MSVRMRETRMIASAYKGMSALECGKEYALPREFAHYLIVTGKADHVSGRVGSSVRRLKDVRMPKKKQGIPFRRLLSLDD